MTSYDDAVDAVEAGRQLAQRHRSSGHADPGGYDFATSLLNYAESPYEGDWTLRSALVRLAQPEPARVGALLDVVRRLDAPLHQAKRALEKATVTCDRALTPSRSTAGDRTVERLAEPPTDPYPDIRTADLARLVAGGLDEVGVLGGYEEQTPLGPEERLSVPLLVMALEFERLAAILAAWALVGPESPPVDAVDTSIVLVTERLDQLGVPVETGPPPGAGRSRRQ